jgi:hypothetical protein
VAISALSFISHVIGAMTPDPPCESSEARRRNGKRLCSSIGLSQSTTPSPPDARYQCHLDDALVTTAVTAGLSEFIPTADRGRAPTKRARPVSAKQSAAPSPGARFDAWASLRRAPKKNQPDGSAMCVNDFSQRASRL